MLLPKIDSERRKLAFGSVVLISVWLQTARICRNELTLCRNGRQIDKWALSNRGSVGGTGRDDRSRSDVPICKAVQIRFHIPQRNLITALLRPSHRNVNRFDAPGAGAAGLLFISPLNLHICAFLGRHRPGPRVCAPRKQDVQKVDEEFLPGQHLQVGCDT